MRSLTLLLMLLVPMFVGCAEPESGQVSESEAVPASLPLLHLQPSTLDMGTVKEGEEAKATLFIRNNSNDTITIVDVQTSCGCTVAEPASKIIAPGGFTTLEVRTDTTIKQGDVKKWVQVTDSTGRTARSILTMKVTENPHLMRDGKGLFSGKCAACHYDPVQGKKSGREIYAAACSMCHGENGKGAYAPKLTAIDDASTLKQLISNGTGTPQMPGFARAQGGPLSKTQVDTLSRWLLSLD
ncbi:MAG TPA: DUF1573 domain-containing protein [Hyphomicrobiales bacterium]|nr:DUF1573 domain-containing protein [Hyphomicrobiales bacterium]